MIIPRRWNFAFLDTFGILNAYLVVFSPYLVVTIKNYQKKIR